MRFKRHICKPAFALARGGGAAPAVHSALLANLHATHAQVTKHGRSNSQQAVNKMHKQCIQPCLVAFMQPLHWYQNMEGQAAYKLSTRCTSSSFSFPLQLSCTPCTGISTWMGMLPTSCQQDAPAVAFSFTWQPSSRPAQVSRHGRVSRRQPSSTSTHLQLSREKMRRNEWRPSTRMHQLLWPLMNFRLQ